MSVQIPIQFVGDTTQLEPALALFAKLGFIAEDELAKFRAANQEFARRQQIIQQTQGPMDKLASSANNVTGNLAKGATNKVIEDLKKQVDDLNKKIEEFKKKSENSGNASGNIFKQLKREYTELVAAAQKAYDAGNKALGDELLAKAGALQDKIGDLRAATKAYASDTAALDSVVQGVTAVAAGYQLAQGAVALFGTKNEEVNRVLVKLQAVMAIVNALTVIQNALQKESALRIGLSNLARIAENALARIGITFTTVSIAAKEGENAANAAGEVITKRRIVVQAIENGLNSQSVVVRWLATAAQWALNAAMDANPIGLLILAIAAVIGAFALFSDSAESAAEEQNKLNQMELAYLDALKAAGDYYKQRGKDAEDAIQREIDQMKARGDSAADVRAKELELANLRKKNADDQVKYYQDEVDNLDQNRRSVAELTIEYEKLNQQKIAEDTDDYDKRIEALKSEIDVTKQKVQLGEDAKNEQIAASDDVTNKQLENDKIVADEGLKSRKASIEAKLEYAKKGTDAEFALQKALAKAEYDLELSNKNLTDGEKEKAEADYVAKIRKIDEEYQRTKLADQLSGVNAQLAATKKGSQAEFELKKKQLEIQRDIQLTNTDLTENQKREIIATSLRKIDDLTNAFLQKQMQDQLNTQLLINDAKLQFTEKGSADELALKKQRLLIQQQLEIASIDKELEGTALGEAKRNDIIAKYKAEGIELDRQAADARIKLQEETYNKQVAYLDQLAQIEASSINTSFERRQQIELEKFDRQNAQLEQQKITEQQRYAEGITTYEEYQRALTDINNAQSLNRIQKEETEQQQIYDLRVRYAEKFQEISSHSLSIISDAEKAASDRRLAGFEDELAHYEELKNNQVISEEAYNAKKKEIDGKIKAEKQAAAQKEKAYAITQILIDTAVAAVKASATPPAPNFVAAGLATAFGLAQAAIAAARPIPQFAKGTEKAPPGWAWVGEQGPELIWLTGGEKIKSAPESRRMVDTYRMVDTPIGAATMAMVNDSPRFSREAIEQMLVLSNEGVRIDYDRLAALIGDQVGEKIQNMPLSMFSFDRRGFRASIIEGNSETQFYNDRYSSR